MVFQESCAQPGVTILHLGGEVLVPSEELKDILLYIYSLRRNQDPIPGLHYCFLTVPP